MSATEATVSAAFTQEQKEYLQGFTAGLTAAGTLPPAAPWARGAKPAQPGAAPEPQSWFEWPLDEISHEEISHEEEFKRTENPLDIWDKLLLHAPEDRAPNADDVYRFKSSRSDRD